MSDEMVGDGVPVIDVSLISDDALRAAIRRVRDEIERNGWHQGSATGPNGEVCIGQASVRACFGGRQSPASGTREEFSLAARLRWATQHAIITLDLEHGLSPDAGYFLPDWNDHPETSLEDVMLVLKHAEDAVGNA